jgi:pimeloyl-ACP methyl ester carboxylesterase
MARPILMPQVGQDLTEGKIVAIHVKLGDKVKKGDIVAEVESEKATFEVEAFETGIVVDLPFKVGDMAIVLKPLMMVGDEGEVLAEAAPKASEKDVKAAPAKIEAFVNTTGKAGSSPFARRLADAAGIDVANLQGSGPGGAIVKKDLEGVRGQAPAYSTASIISTETGLRSLQKGTGVPVVFIHGYGADLSAWRPFILHLGLSNPIYALDLPSHGANANEQADGFEALVQAAHAMIAKAGASTLHLVGHSVGAAIAAHLTGKNGLNVHSLSLLSPAGLGPKVNGDYVEGFLAAKTEVALRVWLEQLVHKPAVLTGALVRATFAARESSAMVANQRKLAAGLFAGNTQLFNIHDALQRFTGPLRIIVGREDRIIPSSYAYSVPGHVAVHHLPQVGHLPQLEATALTARLVAETVRSAA